ncbi:MAG: Ig-like domain-containing protein [Bacteroidales bacterium]|nr:Ig-like domain-containing protein [Bacteroidales bacterium]MDT8373873.1 Ig-like domain-containing protein [Bacteroidales bacterium]
MKNKKYNWSAILLIAALVLAGSGSCTRDYDELELVSYPTTPEVFIDGFSAGLNYAAFGGSKVTAFDVDKEVKYQGSASMRFEVPDFEDPLGAYAGGTYFTTVGRDLSGYDALTFWAKASKSATIDLVGFGNDLGESKYLVSMQNVAVNTNWKKYIIPIPDPSRLKQEKGMFFYSEGPEDGLGYTFWIDEVKFEKLGTIAHRQPVILNGDDRVESAVNGLKFPVGGLGVSFNMPTGIDQTVNAAPAYFTFVSSNESVASVDATGLVSVLSEGTAVITATAGGTDAMGSLTVNSSGDFTHAPVPAEDQEDVISIFSNQYVNVPVDFYNGYWQPYQTTTSADFKVGDDDVLFYTNFNFVGIQFTSPTIDATTMTHLHMDVWIPNAVDPADKLAVKLVDMGPDGDLDGTDLTLVYEIAGPLASQSWISVDIPLSGLSSRSKLAQIILERLGSTLTGFYLDNVYLYGSGGGTPTVPTEAAPAPPARDPADVISLFSNAYTNNTVNSWSAEWDDSDVADLQISGDDVKKYTFTNFAGIDFSSDKFDASGMTHFHIDIWTPDDVMSKSLSIKNVDFGGGTAEATSHILTVVHTASGDIPALATGSWVSVDVPITAFTGDQTRSDLAQMVLSSNLSTLYVDNIYFYKSAGGTGTEPAAAAPTPTHAAASVISMFSGAYTNVTVDTWRTDWSAASYEEVTVAGDATKKYSALNFVGIETTSATIDATAMTHVHLDVWSADFTNFGVKLVDFGADGAYGGGDDVEHQLNYPSPARGVWVSYNIPLSDFAGLTTRGHLAQYILVGEPAGATTIWVDNIYFYDDGGTSATGPTAAAPTPPARSAANVVSIFSDAYTNITTDNFDAGWCEGAAVTQVSIAGNNTLKKNAGIVCHGIDFSTNRQNLSSFTHIHFDLYTDDTDLTGDVFNVKLVDFAGGASEASALEVNINTGTTPAIVAGTWVSVDIDITALGGIVTGNLTRSDVAQIGITTANLTNVWYDNIYLWK